MSSTGSVAGRLIDVALAHEMAAVDQRPDGLDGVQRQALGAVDDARDIVVGESRREAAQQLGHRRVGQWLEVE